MSLLPFHSVFSLDSPLLPQAVRPPPSWGTAPPSPRPGRRRPDPRRRCAVPQPRSNRLLQLHHAVDPHGVQRTSPRCGGGSASAADADASRRQHERRGPPADNLRLRPDGALVVLHVQPPPSIAAGLNPGPIPFGGPSKQSLALVFAEIRTDTWSCGCELWFLRIFSVELGGSDGFLDVPRG
ncbi:Os02g0599800 [Oryza sativa Japonica Group]|uniref:Os02g0599800 protein n=1 Tax=Oryza sativa subsp. japonica TaxID=39947 RepID=A0A0P0VLG5_ORYSJ|nr:Os02g0599800 [Oryza sativa Japonica Group]